MLLLLHGETGNLEIASFYLNTVQCLTCFDNRHKIHGDYYLVTVKPPFIHKTIDCMEHTQKEQSSLPSTTIMLNIYQICHGVGHCINYGSCFLLTLGVKVTGYYYWDILLSQQMLDAIKHVTDDNFAF